MENAIRGRRIRRRKREKKREYTNRWIVLACAAGSVLSVQMYADVLAAEKGDWPCQKSSYNVQLSSNFGSCTGNVGTGQVC